MIKPTEALVIAAVVRNWYPPRQWAVCPNVSWGLNLNHETDIYAVSKSNVVHEVEVKLTKADFNKDMKKQRYRLATPATTAGVDCFWYAVPVALAEHVLANTPVGVGVYAVHDNYKVDRLRCSSRPRGRKRDRDLRVKVWRLAALRYWSLQQSQAAKAANVCERWQHWQGLGCGPVRIIAKLIEEGFSTQSIIEASQHEY